MPAARRRFSVTLKSWNSSKPAEVNIMGASGLRIAMDEWDNEGGTIPTQNLDPPVTGKRCCCCCCTGTDGDNPRRLRLVIKGGWLVVLVLAAIVGAYWLGGQ